MGGVQDPLLHFMKIVSLYLFNGTTNQYEKKPFEGIKSAFFITIKQRGQI